ncbi:MAG: hypothetical protein WDO70_12500 [Alphaproteobacteria bacterium]
MAETHVLSALKDKYAELAGKLKACDDEASRLQAALANLDRTIRLFENDFSPAAIRPLVPRKPKLFQKGTVIRHALDAMREAGKPLSARDLAIMVLNRQGIQNPDNAAVEHLRRVLTVTLKRKLGDGDIAVTEHGVPRLWSIVGAANH